jgi:hypothetical protein
LEDTVIERLPGRPNDAPSEFDKTLEDLVNNILVYNNITLPRPIRCRTLLTVPLESTAIGNTIIISKGLLDTTGVQTESGMQQMGNLSALLAFQIAHIILAHRIDTKPAFNDHLLFPSTSVYKRIPLHHTAADNAAAARKALQLLSVKELTGGQQYFGLYLEQLQQRVKALKALKSPRRRRPQPITTRSDGGDDDQRSETRNQQLTAARGNATLQLPALRPMD